MATKRKADLARSEDIPTPEELPDLWITRQVANELHMSEGHVRKLVRRGELRSYRYMGRTLLFREADVREWYEQHMRPSSNGVG